MSDNTRVVGWGPFRLPGERRRHEEANAQALAEMRAAGGDPELLRALTALRADNARRWTAILHGYYWLGGALACFLGFLGAALSMICLDWAPWWLVAITVVFELATAACLGMSGRR